VLKNVLQRHATGTLLDIGCGEKPYQTLTADLVDYHIGLDLPDSLHSRERVDLHATAYRTAIADKTIDTILCTTVLEHLEEPTVALQEMYRILSPDGVLILSVPLFWHLHEEPRDFYRYTEHGLGYLLRSAGFRINQITPLSGFIVTFGQELVYYLNRFRRGLFRYLVGLAQQAIMTSAYLLHRWDQSHGFTWAYLVVANRAADD
jgi:ubiquinone/menaquinone biosynthesis C-methylase UbiE